MKILLVHNRYRSGTPSGENRVAEQESAALAALGHEVSRFDRSSDEIEHWSAAKKATLPARIVWNPETFRDMRATLRAQRPDVVHVHNTFPLISAAVLYACRDAGVPVVATIHNYRLACANGMYFRDGGVCHDCAESLPLPGLRHGCYRDSVAATAPVVTAMMAHRRAWRSLVSAYILISKSQRDLLRGIRLPDDRVFVRHNLIPFRERPQVPKSSLVVYAGRLEEPKGVRVLMAAWDRYLEMPGDSGLRLTIAGGGPLDGEMAAWAAVRPSVTLAGVLSSADCADLITRARAVLLPSVCKETFGLVAVESMAAGVPPVAADHGAFTELITPGVDGRLLRPGDAEALASTIADIERNPEDYEGFGEAARKTYEQRFDPERSIADLLDIYRYAIKHPVRG
jgi:glycosyltransferase involved in cell wall biosynthesis